MLQYTYEVHVVARDRACLQKKDAGERTDMATVADCWAGAMKAAAGARRSARESFIVDLTCCGSAIGLWGKSSTYAARSSVTSSTSSVG